MTLFDKLEVVAVRKCNGQHIQRNRNSIKLRGDCKMSNYIKLNEDRWNDKNDYTEPLT